MPTGITRTRTTSTYVLVAADGSLGVIDPGMDSDHNWATLEANMRAVAPHRSQVSLIYITHLHPDHLGMAERIRRETGAPIVLHRREQDALDGARKHPVDPEGLALAWSVPDNRRNEFYAAVRGLVRPHVVADRLVDNGQVVSIGGRDMEVIWTPGHTPGHSCLLDSTARTLFCGDHVLGDLSTGIGLGGPSDTNPLADYLESLRKVVPYDGFLVAPGHGIPFHGLEVRAASIARHLLRRAETVREILARNAGATIYEAAASLPWRDGWQRMTGYLLYAALRQIAHHVDLVISGQFDLEVARARGLGWFS